jgi:hypothetical protein
MPVCVVLILWHSLTDECPPPATLALPYTLTNNGAIDSHYSSESRIRDARAINGERRSSDVHYNYWVIAYGMA